MTAHSAEAPKELTLDTLLDLPIAQRPHLAAYTCWCGPRLIPMGRDFSGEALSLCVHHYMGDDSPEAYKDGIFCCTKHYPKLNGRLPPENPEWLTVTPVPEPLRSVWHE